MRTFAVLLATFQFLSFLVAAHPFIIISTKITEVRVQHAVPTFHYERRQNFLDNLESAANSLLGIETTTSTKKSSSSSKKSSSSSKTGVTIPPPAIASSTTSSSAPRTTTTQDNDDDDDENESSSTSSDSSTSTDSESTTTSESSTTTDITSTTSSVELITSTPSPSPTVATVQASATASLSNSKDDDDSSGVPAGGVAIAVIMSLVILLIIAWLVFKYHPRSRAWWAARQEKRFKERSHRDALDGPASPGANLRQQALSDGAGASRRQTLKTFFAPKTVHLGGGQEIRRKPVNWGADSSSTTGAVVAGVKMVRSDSEKIPITTRAAPMGATTPPATDSEKEVVMSASAAPLGNFDRYSLVPQPVTKTTPVSPVSMGPRESLEMLPPVSPISRLPSSSGKTLEKERNLPALPPVPSLPQLIHAKRGSDGVFRLS